MIPWSVAHQALQSMKFSRQEYWNRLPFSTPGDLPDPGTEPTSFASPASAGRFFITRATWGTYLFFLTYIKWLKLLFEGKKKNIYELNKHSPMLLSEMKNSKKINTLDFQT